MGRPCNHRGLYKGKQCFILWLWLPLLGIGVIDKLVRNATVVQCCNGVGVRIRIIDQLIAKVGL